MAHLAMSTSEPCVIIAETFERIYYRYGQVFIKRSLRPTEFKTGYKGLHVPLLGKTRLRNDAECLRYIYKNCDIPVPALHAAFEYDGAFFLAMNYIEGKSMSTLEDDEKAIVRTQVQEHLATLQRMTSGTIGGPSGIIVPPYRVLKASPNAEWSPPPSEDSQYVFCHNDLSQHNIIVDTSSLKIKAIIDWEYAGFYPPSFEAPFYERPGPSVALGEERDDVPELLRFFGASTDEGR
ncbi:kinase-like domain-containing protein [Aspergillus floccosus]